MSDSVNAIEFVRLIIQAIADGRKEAKELVGVTDDQLRDYHAKLVAEEKAEIERGKQLAGVEDEFDL